MNTNVNAAFSEPSQRVRIWDAPTRVFHWGLALAVVGLVVTGKMGEMIWHMRLGLLVMALLVFRLVWGLVGGRWSRFIHFVYAPTTVWAYLRGDTQRDPMRHERLEAGHSPMGALSVFAMLGILGFQVATGLVADDEIATTGPLYRFVSSATAAWATGWHKGWGQWLLLGLVALHVLAIVYYTRVKKKPLVTAMLTGDKASARGLPSSRDDMTTRVLALVIAAAAGGLAYGVGRLAA
jgi:cytochrome b